MPAPLNKFTFVFAGKSDTGLVRTENQDSFGKFPEDNSSLYGPKGQLFIVADGMGGHRGGKEASAIAVKVVSSEFFGSAFDESVALKEAIEKANFEIFSKSGDKSEFGRMGTTCTALVLKGDRGYIGHVGDSRVYRIENNRIEQLTNDHTRVQEMLREGLLTPEEARNYPSKSVLARALGVDEKVRIDILDDLPLKRGQTYILCSDGLAKISKGEILQIVNGNSSSDACDILISLANERGGKDNVTVVIVKIDPEQTLRAVPPPAKKRTPGSSKSFKKGWAAIAAVLLVIMVLLYLQYQSSGVNPSEDVKVSTAVAADPMQKPDNDVKLDPVEDTDSRLLAQADQLLKEKDYDNAYIVYKSVLNSRPDNQEAVKGLDLIAGAYLNIAGGLMKENRYRTALKYYKKAEEVKPDDVKIKALIAECSDKIAGITPEENTGEKPEVNPAVAEVKPESRPAPPPFNDAASRIAASGFGGGWIYPNINKSECTVNTDAVKFSNTSSEKFILYNKDLFDVNLSASVEIDASNSVVGLVIGYSSPLDYYVFKYREGGNFVLQRISGNVMQKLFEIPPQDAGPGGLRKLRIIYTNNIVNIYNEHGLLKSYRSVWGIFGKAGLYVDKNTSASFTNVTVSGSTALK